VLMASTGIRERPFVDGHLRLGCHPRLQGLPGLITTDSFAAAVAAAWGSGGVIDGVFRVLPVGP
jgi:hypothetical protein